MRLRYSIVVLCLFISSIFHAQIEDSTKIHVSFDSKYWASVKGSTVTFIELKPYNRYEELKISSFDKQLNQSIIIDEVLDKKYKFKQQWSNDSSFFILLSQTNAKKHLLIEYFHSTKKHRKTFFETFMKVEAEKFRKFGDYAYIASTVKQNPILVQVNLVSNKIKVLPYPMLGNAKIEEMKVHEEPQQMDIIISSLLKRETHIHLKSYALNGELVQEKKYKNDPDDEREFISTNITRIGVKDFYITGTYSKDGRELNGLYTIKCEDDKDKITYTPISSFKNYYNFLPQREREKKEEDIIKKTEKGKDVTIQEKLLLHDVITLDSTYYILAEAYYPTFRQESFVTYLYGRPMIQYRTVFNGWEKSHFLSAKFSMKGKLMSDTSIVIHTSKSTNLVKDIYVSEKEDKKEYSLFYSKSDKIYEADLNLKNKENFTPIDLPHMSFGGIRKWYDNTFIGLFTKIERPPISLVIITNKKYVVLCKFKSEDNDRYPK